ncbi:uncharacterized protein LOC135095582 [Scylla paramamosain]|uniref:uncharacterized protein LOC135095582 n=1 Tax=Scylla paramamosain TaxID=85552 RepID=UPI003083B8FF
MDLLTIFVLLFCGCSLNNKVFTVSHLVRQTATSYPWDLEGTCSIAKIPMKVANRYTCLTPCVGMLGCQMYCVTYEMCHYYRAWVTPHYAGTGGAAAYSECFTFRHAARDITGTITSIQTTADVYDVYEPELAINGYFCDHFLACFLGDYTSKNKDLIIDLGVARNVSAVEVIVASADMWSSPNTGSLRVRLGNDLNYKNNPQFAYFPGYLPRYTEVRLSTPSPPMLGRYLVLTAENSNAYYGVCDLRILG